VLAGDGSSEEPDAVSAIFKEYAEGVAAVEDMITVGVEMSVKGEGMCKWKSGGMMCLNQRMSKLGKLGNLGKRVTKKLNECEWYREGEKRLKREEIELLK
jgi:hypothetical protein